MAPLAEPLETVVPCTVTVAPGVVNRRGDLHVGYGICHRRRVGRGARGERADAKRRERPEALVLLVAVRPDRVASVDCVGVMVCCGQDVPMLRETGVPDGPGEAGV